MPELELTFINTGISGNRVCDLRDRWQQDVINHKPDVVSILIGINDTDADTAATIRRLPISSNAITVSSLKRRSGIFPAFRSS